MAQTISQPLQKVALTLCEDANTPRSLAVFMLLKNNELGQLFSLKTDPLNYFDAISLMTLCGFSTRGRSFISSHKETDITVWGLLRRNYSERYFLDVQCTDFLRKLNVDVEGIDRKGLAVENFFTAEHECYKTNQRLHKFIHNGPFGPQDLPFIHIVDEMKRFVKKLLGPLPDDLIGRFGPGSTFDDRGRLTTVPDKISSRPTVTEDATCLHPLWSRTSWSRALVSDSPSISEPRVVRGNRFTTVPKDATKDRGICIEPGVNVFFQLAVGRHIKRRFLTVGMDLARAQAKHRSIAMEASRSEASATIDLSNASDTVCYSLVKLLLPEEWFTLVSSLRSPFTLLNGKWHRLEKFSSMGNGFTFELETLLFLAICVGISHARGLDYLPGRDIHVYGDDIIVPSKICHDVVSGLQWFGFTPNAKKTFLSGPFRESCGGDFYHGVAVRPFYQKEEPYEPQHWISLANGLRRVGYSNPRSDFRWMHLKRSWFRALDALPSSIRRLRGPICLGDLVIHDEGYTRKWRSNGIGYIAVYRPIARPLPWVHWKPHVMLASALYGIPSTGPLARDSVTGYKVGWVPYS